MSRSDKYEAFRQYMFNELGVSKEDIRSWIREAVEQQVEKMLYKTFGNFEPNEAAAKMIADYIGNNYWKDNELKDKVASQLVRKLELNINLKK